MEQQRDDIQVELFGDVEGSFVEAPDFICGGACAFGKDDDAVAAVYEILQRGETRFGAVYYRIVIGHAHYGTKDG